MVPSNTNILRSAIVTAAVACVIALGAGCSSGSSTASSSTTSSSPAGNSITIKDFKFAPTPLTVKVGASITVTNDDNTDHELKANDGSFDAGRFATGSGSFTATKAGTFPYHCDVHDYMTGVIQVTDS